MKLNFAFLRTLFFLLSVIFMMAYAIGESPEINIKTLSYGIFLGVLLGSLLIGLELLFRRFPLLSYNITILGLFFGYLMGLACLLILDTLITITTIPVHHQLIEIIKIVLFISSIYLGVMMTIKASHEIYFSVPFIRLEPVSAKTNEIVVDLSALGDPRTLGLATSGLLDRRLIIPRFLLKELQIQEESKDEMTQGKAKLSLEILKKMEGLPHLSMRYSDTDFPEAKEASNKTLYLARLLDAYILSSDMHRLQLPHQDDIKIINIHTLSNALKPLMQRGEYLHVKIQRHGNEENQGVGYLEDGTMVVVNGGGDYLGKTIKVSVLSVKHTATGRMIFSNLALEERNA